MVTDPNLLCHSVPPDMFWNQTGIFPLFCPISYSHYGLGSRIRDVEAFWFKTEIKIIYFVTFYLIDLILSDCMVYPDLILNISKIHIKHNQKTKKLPLTASTICEVKNDHTHVTTQRILNNFIFCGFTLPRQNEISKENWST